MRRVASVETTLASAEAEAAGGVEEEEEEEEEEALLLPRPWGFFATKEKRRGGRSPGCWRVVECVFLGLGLAAGLCGLVAVLAMRSGTPVSTAHMSTRQRFGDAYWVLVGWWRQREPRGQPTGVALTQRAKARLTRRANTSAALASCAAQEPYLVMHLKVPKAASTTVFDLVNELSTRNAFAVNSRPMYVDDADPHRSAQEYVAYYAALPRRTVRTAHGAYLDFGKFGEPRPAFIALMRDPLQRLESHYNYLHWGPRSTWAKVWKGHAADAPTFKDCADAHYLDAQRSIEGPARRRRLHNNPLENNNKNNNDNPNKGTCLYWSNVQLAYFCGLERDCRGAPAFANDAPLYAFGSQASLSLARRNIARDFVAVGVVEDLDRSFALLEKVLPTYLGGMLRAYHRKKVWSRATTKPEVLPTAPPAVSNRTRAVEAYLKTAILGWEYDLYADVQADFAAQLRTCGIITG